MNSSELLETKSYLLLRDRVKFAVETGTNTVVYGPPSSEKSFLLNHLCKRFTAAGKPVIYMYCGPRTTEAHLWRGLAEAAEVPVRSSLRWACRYAVLQHMRALPKLPAIILDEAQHLDTDALEGIRQLHDVTRRDDRRGCGIILAGSHTLLLSLIHPQRALRLEQVLSRFPHRVQLQGMTEKEILTLAARTLGNGKPATFSKEQEKALLERCTVKDCFFVGTDGKAAPREYFSSRRLLEYLQYIGKQGQEVTSVSEERVH